MSISSIVGLSRIGEGIKRLSAEQAWNVPIAETQLDCVFFRMILQ